MSGTASGAETPGIGPHDSEPSDARSPMARLLDRPNSPATVADATKGSAQSRVLRREPQQNLLLARCGTEWFAFPAECVAQVARVTKVHALPHRTNNSFRGLTASSGAVVPVVDFHALLGIPRAASPEKHNPRMVILATASESWAFEADDVPGVYSMPRTAVKPLPLTVEQAPNRVTSGLLATTHGPASLIDPVRLLAEFKNSIR